ncbi:MAG: hypothetical protein ACXW32_05755, partial [Limisphaerales bacterium]
MGNEVTIDPPIRAEHSRSIGEETTLPASADAAEGAGNGEEELQRSFSRYDQQITVNNIQLGCLLGMVLMPAGVILDFFTYPNDPGIVREFFLLRIWCSVLIFVFWLFVRTDFGRANYRSLGITLALLPAFFISLMIARQDGAASHYYAGLNLVLLVVGFILHWTVRQSVIATVTVLGMYLAACYWQNPQFIATKQREDFANNIYFLVLTGIIVVAGSGYHYRLRYREYALLFELDKKKEELEENHRKLKALDEVKSRFFANISHELRTPLTL